MVFSQKGSGLSHLEDLRGRLVKDVDRLERDLRGEPRPRARLSDDDRLRDDRRDVLEERFLEVVPGESVDERLEDARRDDVGIRFLVLHRVVPDELPGELESDLALEIVRVEVAN